MISPARISLPFPGYGNYIADIAYASNVIFDDGNEIRIGEIYLNITNTLSPADESARMELVTNAFWTADYGQYIYEEAMSDTDSGSYKTLGGKTYSIKLSDLMSTNINEYEWILVDADSLKSKGYKSVYISGLTISGTLTSPYRTRNCYRIQTFTLTSLTQSTHSAPGRQRGFT